MQTETPHRPLRPSRSGRGALAVVGSLAVHAGAVAVLLLTAARHSPLPPGPVLDVALAPAPPPPEPVRPPAAEPSPAPVKAAQPRAARLAASAPAIHSVQPAPRLSAPTLPTGRGGAGVAAAGDDAVGDAELAGAAVAGGSGGGGDCDMASRLQAALRRDRLVQAAMAPLAEAPHRAFKVWNGDWVAHSGQDGHGLAAVREVILLEVGFSPAACRRAVVHGLVVLAVPTEAGGAVRLALGTDEWRWSDLLGLGARSAG